MLALPAAPAPPARRQLLVGTALGCAAGAMLYGGMVAVYLRLRMNTINGVDPVDGQPLTWMPSDVRVPEVAANNMLLAFLAVFVFAQWAVYAARREQKSYTVLALGLTFLVGIAIINSQAFIYERMGIVAAGGAYSTMFYALTGTFLALMIGGVVFTAVTAFRYLGGRIRDREIVSAHAVYWYFLGAVFSALWFVVYVTK